mgnify:CR=1 FL=1
MLSAQEAFGPYIDLWVKTIGIVPSIFVFAVMFTTFRGGKAHGFIRGMKAAFSLVIRV